jgi:hypothetical protein
MEGNVAYRGHVQGGKIVLDDAIALPEGAVVQIDVVDEEDGATLYERLKSVIGKANGLPPDAAQNVDQYLYDQLAPLAGAAKGLPPDLANNHDTYLHGQIEKE